MSLGVAHTVALSGLEGRVVRVEADVGGGLPGMILLGLPDASLSEAKDRVRSAARNLGLPLSPQRLTVNLVPAALPKRGPAFDVSILVALLVAQRQVRAAEDTVFLGELGLDGVLRSVSGVLPCVLAAQRAGFARVVVPSSNADEAGLVPGIEVVAMATAAELLLGLGADPECVIRPPVTAQARRDGTEGGVSPVNAGLAPSLDLEDVVGQPVGRRVLEVAAAGGHHLLLVGPAGAGKTMLAERLPGILPELSEDEAVVSACLRSVGGFGVGQLLRTPPFQAPHHTATTPALVGGGSGIPRPGAASLAHGGVLFLDEAPEFAARTLDALREPLESGRLTLHRAAGAASYPAAFQLVLAANPCPCGKPGRRCECAALARRRYWARLSGPLLDRVDMRVDVPPADTRELVGARRGESSSDVRARVQAARARQAERWAGEPAPLNARVPARLLRRSAWAPAGEVAAALSAVAGVHALTGRGVDRVLRVAWTLADLAGRERPGVENIQEAAMMRGGVA